MSGQGRSIFIQVDHNVFGSAVCSAIQFDNLVIAHGNLLYFLSTNMDTEDDDRELNNFLLIVNEIMHQQYFVNPKQSKKEITYNFKVVKENVLGSNFLNSDMYNREHMEREIASGGPYSSEDARLCLVHRYELDSIDCAVDPNSGCNYYERYVIPTFLFLMTGIPTKHMFQQASHAFLTLTRGAQIYPGLSIAVESTPFGNLAFYNSLSRGIISKTIGPEQDGFFIDTRLVPGCEGAPIHVFEDGRKGVMIGIVICILSSLAEEWTGFSLGISLENLLKAVLGLQIDDYIPFNNLRPSSQSLFMDMDLLSSAVILVRCQHKWGSGVVIDADEGLVLTCAHTVNHAQGSVQVVFNSRQYHATVVYASPPSHPYDLAVLSVGRILGLRSLVMAETSPVVGESVVTVGYVFSNMASVLANGNPMLTSGSITKISRSGGPMQTTCCTKAGVSGGAVLRPPNQLIGIAVSNVVFGSTVLPFFSFAVSVDDFRSAIAQYMYTKNPIYLQSLTVKCPEMRMKWLLQESKL